MADDHSSRNPDRVSNPRPKVPVVLCLDVSTSMRGLPMEKLNEGLQFFYQELRDDPIALATAQVAIVAFAGEVASFRDFDTISETDRVPKMSVLMESALGKKKRLPVGSDIGKAVQVGLKKIRERVEGNGNVGHVPVLLLLSDGQSSTPRNELQLAARECRQREAAREVQVYPVGVGERPRLDVLGLFSRRPALPLSEFDFRAVFNWLSSLVKSVSHSVAGTSVKYGESPVPDFVRPETAPSEEQVGDLWTVTVG